MKPLSSVSCGEIFQTSVMMARLASPRRAYPKQVARSPPARARVVEDIERHFAEVERTFHADIIVVLLGRHVAALRHTLPPSVVRLIVRSVAVIRPAMPVGVKMWKTSS
jgi:hypothetical protein